MPPNYYWNRVNKKPINQYGRAPNSASSQSNASNISTNNSRSTTRYKSKNKTPNKNTATSTRKGKRKVNNPAKRNTKNAINTLYLAHGPNPYFKPVPKPPWKGLKRRKKMNNNNNNKKNNR